MKKIRVMIVEDSPTVLELLKVIINSDPRLEVAAAVESGEKALEIIERVKPDVISMDIRLPGINGFVVTQRIMQQNPTPIVVVSASVESEELKISMNALRAGALAVVEKPVGINQEDFEKLAGQICTQLAIMSEVKVVKQRFPRDLDFTMGKKKSPFPSSTAGIKSFPVSKNFAVLGIAASTGGPNALLEVLCQLPPDFPLPILLVQHITRSFLEGFVSWLDSLCPFRVRMVKNREIPAPGNIYVAAPDFHLVLDKGFVTSRSGPLVCSQRPSATILFQSMAENHSRHALGILLTGMGEDGGQGLKAIKDAGGYTIAEDESTAVVYGMPGSAVRIGAVCESLPVTQITQRIIGLIYNKNELNHKSG